MKAASLSDIKSELETRSDKELVSYCVRLSEFRKENKELLTYVLFEENFPEIFIDNFKQEMNQLFSEINRSNIYYVRKSIRKILRYTNKYVRFISSAHLACEMLIHFCNSIIIFDIPVRKSAQLMNIYDGQLKKIDSIISTLHPDLQYDLKKQLKKI
ncbi:MAG TPA: hypothetical protein VG847_01710 [Chitinophagaceae bacterium]|nr:hypothetical protein [Chitinophagaceae bacterium]